MPMTVMNNSVALMTLNELNKNTQSLGKSLKQASSGVKINSAGDGASEYAISERMRVQIRGLGQDIQNVQNGKSLIRTAEGGIQGVIDELRNLKALALDSANDTNTDVDRATMQKVFSSRMDEINDIAATTSYNSRLLLDGTYYGPKEYQVAVIEDTPSSPSITPVSPTRPTGAVTIIPSGDYTISADGVYKLDTSYHGTITIAATNVELQQTDTEVTNARIKGNSSGNMNLWLNGINIRNTKATGVTTDESVIRFYGSDNTLNLLGTNIARAYTSAVTAAINIGDGLTITDGGNGDGSILAQVHAAEDASGTLGSGTAAGAAIGTDAGESSNAYLIINSGKVSAAAAMDYGAGIGSGGNGGSIGKIIINGGTVYGYSFYGAGIGSGGNGTVAGDIVINSGTVKGASGQGIVEGTGQIDAAAGAGIGSGENGSVGNIVILGGTITAKANGSYGAGIGTGSYTTGKNASVGNITIKHAGVSASSTYAQAVGSGALYNGTLYQGTEWNGTIGSIKVYGGEYTDAFSAGYHTYTRDVTDTTGDDVIIDDDDTKDAQYKKAYYPGHPLIIQTGTKANQQLRVFINDMHTTAMGLDSAGVDPQEKALQSLALLDSALEYALGENTRMGAYIIRLNHTEDNLVVVQEDTVSTESVIRDADMAKAITSFTKSNILAQSAQAMLAQANQESSNVLSLLK